MRVTFQSHILFERNMQNYDDAFSKMQLISKIQLLRYQAFDKEGVSENVQVTRTLYCRKSQDTKIKA